MFLFKNHWKLIFCNRYHPIHTLKKSKMKLKYFLLLMAFFHIGFAKASLPMDTVLSAESVVSIEPGLSLEPILSLEQCISLALENNRKAETARNEISMAVDMKREAFTKYFPEIAATGMIFWANHDILQYNLLDIIELGIIKKGKMAGVQALQPIFTGGRIVNGNRLAELGEEVARLRMNQTNNELRLTTETMYWKLITLQATDTTLREAISTLDAMTSEVTAAVEAGIALNNDLLKVKLKRNAYEAELVDLENGIKLVKMLLGQYIGLGTEGNIFVESVVPAEPPCLPTDLYIDNSAALPLTPDYGLLNKNVEAKKLEKRITLGGNLPSVAFGAGWYYHDLLEQNHNFGALQIAVEIPLSGWWSGAYAIKRKNMELANARIELEDLSEELQIEMQSKWDDVTAACRKMGIEREGIIQSEENLRLSRLYYEAGLSNISDLLDAETELKEANERYISSYGAFMTARASYLIATGR